MENINKNENAYERMSKKIPESNRERVSWQLSIAAKIHSLLDKGDISEEELQKKLNLSEEQLDMYIRGIYDFNVEELKALSSLLGEELPPKPGAKVS